jgi:GNAT superfamily N-acetyltransferase
MATGDEVRTTNVEVRPVSSRRELRTFIRLPWRLYSDEPNWVAPLVMELKKRLDQSKNPFFKHAEAQYFLAYRDGQPIGRISAHVDRNFNEFQDNEWGLFGWFECEDDPEAARALLDVAEQWLRERGRDRMVGPMDFTTNDEIGLLIEGHEYPPIILCPWHHRYYQRLFEQDVGMTKAMDLYMWSLYVDKREKVHPAIWEAADKLESEHGIVCRNFRKKDLQAEVTRFLEVYNAAWENNWASVPLNEEEVRHYAKDLKPVLDENWAMVAERKDTGEVVGAALTLPDFNQVLAKLNGRLLPFGWVTALREKRKIDAVRVFALGVKPEYQHTGVAARFYQMHFDAAERTPQKGGEMGWILEVNKPMNRGMEGMGGEIKRRYRVYERML